MVRCSLALAAVLAAALFSDRSSSADEQATFFRGLNLNGPPVTIDGQQWEGQDSPHYRCQDRAFENQNVPLIPPTDPERAKMIRSSRWGGNEIVLTNLPADEYSLFLYVWEDNNPETFSISVNGREVTPRYVSGKAGQWERLGPWLTPSKNGEITLTSRGGAANFSGIEIWKGKHSGQLELDQEEVAFFERHVRPVLVEHCYECHSAGAREMGGQLRLDTRSGWQIGGEHGPAVIPRDPEKSLLVKAIGYEDAALLMPPDGKLPDEAIARIVEWVKRGASDPRDDRLVAEEKKTALLDDARQRWAFRPPLDPPLPAVQAAQWPKTGVDHFILSRLEPASLAPMPDASKRVLIRRATYDLTGLPPTPQEVSDFLTDESADAFHRVIDRLLESPRYGERWGRHWLDVVRYADTAGDNSDFPIPQAHLYRDWVIQAIQRDLPYDEFVRKQLAGDLLPSTSDEDRRQKVIATGYIANARRFGSRVSDYPQHLTIEDTIDNLGRAFLGLTVNCARCHDHKFDPILTEDYYALYGIFHSTRYPWPGIELDQKQRDLVPLCSPGEAESAARAHALRLKELEAEVARLEKERDQAAGEDRKKLDKDVAAARQAAERHSKTPLPIPLAYAVAESPHPENVRVQYKGDPAKTGAIVERGFLTVLGGQKLPPDDATSGRLRLAEWIADPANPLTARVMVNRLWAGHFGRGLVPTPNDFGQQGKPPTHPELLDWLAHRFVESGWSLKAMHRLIMQSRVYQLAAIHDPAAIPGDPANDLLSGYRPRRLDAESIRDSLLMVSGELDLTPPGPHPFPPMWEWRFTQHNPFKAVYETNRRSVYLMAQRIQRHPYLAIFDGPDPAASTPVRLVSTTPLQALFLLNDPFVHRQADSFAARLLSEAPDQQSRIDLAYEILLARPPSDEERQAGARYLAQARQLLKDSVAAGELDRSAWQSYVRTLLRLNEFVYLD